jgi:hypothetical protein
MPKLRRPNTLQIPTPAKMAQKPANQTPPVPVKSKDKPEFPKFNVTMEPGQSPAIDFDEDQKPKSIVFKQIITVNLNCDS